MNGDTVAPISQQPTSIKDIVVEQLHSLGITNIVIVDDAFSPGIDTAQWSLLIETVRESDRDLLVRIEELVGTETGNVEQPPSDRLLMSIRRLVPFPVEQFRASPSS